MILIADGGSTKIDWCLIDNGLIIKRFITTGANPFHRTKDDICEKFSQTLLPETRDFKIDRVFFYGAGCSFPEKKEIIKTAIAANIGHVNIEVESDLFGAALGLWGNEAGIACILGTGSNSCFYDGNKIAEHVSPLGYLLGDEGGGSVLGRNFIGSCLKNQFTPEIKAAFFDYIKLTVPEIMDKVYGQPLPGRFLASVCPFIKENIHEKSIHDLVYGSFEDFFRKNVMQYDYQNYKVSFTGSIAFHFKTTLLNVAADLKIEIENIEQSPINGLIKFHSK